MMIVHNYLFLKFVKIESLMSLKGHSTCGFKVHIKESYKLVPVDHEFITWDSRICTVY